MNKLTTKLDSLRAGKKKALSLFITAGFPTADITVPLVVELAKNGADMIELGIPFSDPIADGPVIQHSSEVSLRNGTTLQKTFAMAEEIRKRTDIPLILMGYANPILAYGLPAFFDRCNSAGIDGCIIPDISLEESEEYRSLALKNNISAIFLAAPTTTTERLTRLDNASTGFLYCVSVIGVTGERSGLMPQVPEFLNRVHATVKKNPVLVGFGISTPDDAVRLAGLSDGVIIGSALVKLLSSTNGSTRIEKVVHYVRSIRQALDSLH